MVLPVKIVSCFGVLEHWSVGKNKGLNFNLNWFFHYSITPARCRKRGKTIEAPSGGSLNPGPLGPGFFTDHLLR